MALKAETIFTGDAVRGYGEGPPRQVPGFSSLHRMTALLLAERAHENGHILVLGAGGGLELKAFAAMHKGWTFDGVDPSADMLRVAETVVGEHRSRIRFHETYIKNAPTGPFDGAACLLTFHFIPHDQRLDTLRQIHARLKAGAPFVMAHISFPQTEPERSLWIERHVLYGSENKPDPDKMEKAQNAMREKLTILTPQEEEAMLYKAGFSGVSLFYAGFSFKGWVAYA